MPASVAKSESSMRFNSIDGEKAKGASAINLAILSRFFGQIAVGPSRCWEWRGTINRAGYGVFSFDGLSSSAHRFAYGWFVADVRSGMHVDHLCRNTRCVNPVHLEAVTPRENNRRAQAAKKFCKNGHPWVPENLKPMKNGARGTVMVCVSCASDRHLRAIHERAKNRRRVNWNEMPTAYVPRRDGQFATGLCARGHAITERNVALQKVHGRYQRVCLACRVIRTERRREARRQKREVSHG